VTSIIIEYRGSRYRVRVGKADEDHRITKNLDQAPCTTAMKVS